MKEIKKMMTAEKEHEKGKLKQEEGESSEQADLSDPINEKSIVEDEVILIEEAR